MDTMPLISVVLYSIPEAYLIFSFGLIVLGCKAGFLNILPAAVIFALITYFVRQLPTPFGLHVLIHYIFIWGLFVRAFKLNVKKALLATFLSTGTLLALESTVLYGIQHAFDLNTEEIWQDAVLRTAIGWPHLLVWVLITICLQKYNINLNRFKGYHPDAGED